jgi:hypothetical protein
MGAYQHAYGQAAAKYQACADTRRQMRGWLDRLYRGFAPKPSSVGCEN